MARIKSIVFTVTNDLSYDQRMKRICTVLANAGYSVTLIGFKKIASIPLGKSDYHEKRLNLIFKKGKLFYVEFNIRLFLLLLFGKRYHIYGAVDLDTILPHFIVSRLKQSALVYDAHEYFTELPEIADRPFIKSIWEYIARITLPYIHYNYTVGSAIANELSERYGRPYQVIRNVPEYYAAPLREGHSGKKIFLYQGALNKGRGIEEMMQAIQDMDAELHIAGEGDLSDALRVFAKTLPHATKIKFLGYVPPAELVEITQTVFAGLNLVSNEGKSYYLSLSNKFFDYIMAGIPQVTMDYPEYADLNNQYNVALTIDKLEVAQLKSAMQQLMDDTSLYNQLAENTGKAAKELNWQLEKEKLLKIYADIS